VSLLSYWVERFSQDERAAGSILDEPATLAQGIAAVNFHSGFADLKVHLAIPIADPAPEPPIDYPEITALTDISVSEWAMIRPLFLLYVERETALQLEASRGMGIDVFGRSSSEVQGDIALIESEYPHRAFLTDIITV